jgi:sugar lactone lactonase YvrE
MDGTGSDASFSQFGAMAVDAAGNLFVSQPDSHTVRKITPDHVVTTIAGVSGQSGTVDGKGAGARFNQPRGLAVDASQNVWVSELGSGLLRRIAPDGTVTTPLGYATPLSERPKVQRLAFASGSGNLYFTSDYGVGRFTSTGSVAWLAGHELPVNGVIGEVAGLAVDAVGNVVVQSALGPLQTSTLRKYAPGGEPVPFGSNDSVVVHSPFAAISTSTESIGADASGNIYVSDLYSKGYAFQFDIFSPTGGAINMVAPSGTLTQVANWPADSANAVAPAYLAAGSDGALYFVDLLSGNLLKWTAGAGANVLASTGPPRTSLFDLGPRWSLAADGTGTVYVRMDGALRKVVNGALVTIAGASSFVAPGAIVADSAGNVYVADREVIRKVAVDVTVTTVAGQRGSVGLATGALPGGLGTIGAMALAPGGVLYVISDNALVRVKLP